MKADDVLKKQCTGLYEGYMPQSISEHDKEPFAWNACTRLLRVPPKITHFFERKKILEVRKSTHERNDIDNYYLMRLTDGTFLEVTY